MAELVTCSHPGDPDIAQVQGKEISYLGDNPRAVMFTPGFLVCFSANIIFLAYQVFCVLKHHLWEMHLDMFWINTYGCQNPLQMQTQVFLVLTHWSYQPQASYLGGE